VDGDHVDLAVIDGRGEVAQGGVLGLVPGGPADDHPDVQAVGLRAEHLLGELGVLASHDEHQRADLREFGRRLQGPRDDPTAGQREVDLVDAGADPAAAAAAEHDDGGAPVGRLTPSAVTARGTTPDHRTTVGRPPDSTPSRTSLADPGLKGLRPSVA
jgi:hypothetical protein